MICALCCILVKCRDLRIFPGKKFRKFRFPGTKNYYAALSRRGGLGSSRALTHPTTLRRREEKLMREDEEEKEESDDTGDIDLGSLLSSIADSD